MLVVQGTNSVSLYIQKVIQKLNSVHNYIKTHVGKQDTFITSGMCRNSLWYYNTEVINLISKPL